MYYAKIAVALGVAAIPEGLPAVITLCLSLGTKRMAQRNVIVRNLPSVETLGCTSVICTDKTGTLTTNQMTVKTIVSFNTSSFGIEDIILKERGVEGVSYQPIGTVENLSLNDMQMKGWQDFAMICSLCNEAVVVYKDGIYERIGEPTEAALKVLVEKLGAVDIVKAYDPKMLVRQCNDHWENKFEKLAVLEFNRERKSMSSLCRSKSTQSNTLFVKGAAEVLIDRCSKIELEDGKVIDIDSNLRKKLISCVSEISRRPLRCLALALKPSYSLGQDLTGLKTKEDSDQSAVLKDPSSFAKLESDLTLVGFCGIKDPARTEAGAAILKCREAGIRVMMITGDSKETAVSIAKDVNIFDKNEDTTQKAFTGQEFFSLPEQQQLNLLSQGNMVFCRTEPRDKQRLISLLERLKEIPAMTGDGVNDAPALKQAAIGIAMGITGTEVAKNSADMVLADDNFATIVSAVEEGRAIYGNMQSFICFLISTNIGEILSIFIATLMGLPEPLTSLHLLWVNLVTDGPPATSLGFNPPDPNAMTKPPRPKDSTIMTKWLLIRYIITGLYVGFATIGIFIWWYLDKGVSFNQLIHWGDCLSWNDFNPNFKTEHYMENPCEIFTEFRSYPQTLSLSVLVVIELLKALSAVSLDTSIIKMPPWKNRWLIPGVLFPALCHLMLLYIPALSSIFSLEPLSQRDWKVWNKIKNSIYIYSYD
jgi:Ca2+-transporting ATPase